MNQSLVLEKKSKTIYVVSALLYTFGALFLCIGLLVKQAYLYKEAVFGQVNFEQIYYSVTGNMQGANMSVFSRFYLLNLPLTVAGSVIFTILGVLVLTKLLDVVFRIIHLQTPEVTVEPLPELSAKTPMDSIRRAPAKSRVIFLLSIVYFFGCAYLMCRISYHALVGIGAVDHFKRLSAEGSTLYEEYYKDPNEVKVVFPEKKKNLIYIFLESMENTYMVDKCGGAQDISFIPELTQLMYDNTSFFDAESINGAKVEYGCDWTVAAMLAQSSGIPMCMPNGQNEYEDYTYFLPGMTNLGDILEAEGYNLEVMFGSDSAFGGRCNLYGTHGNYEIFDHSTAIERGYIPEDYNEWWGFEDRKLFEYAKIELQKLASKEEPFSMTLLTADTHYIEGYVDEQGLDLHKDHYQNALSNSDLIITDFISWLKEQDFYEDTVIVLSGDHLNMGGAYISQLNPEYERTVFGLIINSEAEIKDDLIHEYCTMDMFPTTLAAMGCKIPGERLALGTNLFSSEPTLVEELGYEALYEELAKPSSFYERNFAVQKDRAYAYR